MATLANSNPFRSPPPRAKAQARGPKKGGKTSAHKRKNKKICAPLSLDILTDFFCRVGGAYKGRQNRRELVRKQTNRNGMSDDDDADDDDGQHHMHYICISLVTCIHMHMFNINMHAHPYLHMHEYTETQI